MMSDAPCLSALDSWRLHTLRLLLFDSYSFWVASTGDFIFVWRKPPLYETSRWYVDIIRHLNEHHATFSYGFDGAELEVRFDRMSFLSLLAGRVLDWRKAITPNTYYHVTQKKNSQEW